MTATTNGSAVWLASYPKSGNTWVRLLLNALEHGPDFQWSRQDGPHDAPELTQGMAMSAADPAQTAALLRLTWARSDTTTGRPRRRKTHRPWGQAADGYPWGQLPGGRSRAIYVVRDPRAVTVSWAHHTGRSHEDAVADLATLNPGFFEWGGSEDPGWIEGSWSGHVTSWLDQQDVPVLLVRYEDLHERTAHELVRMADFVGVPHGDDLVADAVARCEFRALALRETLEGFVEAAASDRVFFRRGEVDSWRHELSPELADRVRADHGDVMERLGYH